MITKQEKPMFKTPEKIKEDHLVKKAFMTGIKTLMDKATPTTNDKEKLVLTFAFRLDHLSFPDYIPTIEKQLSDAGWVVEIKEGHSEMFLPTFGVTLTSKTPIGLE